MRIAPHIVSALLAILVYGVTIKGTYIYDDLPVALNDARLTQPSLWKLYWTQPFMASPDKLYRPLVSLSFAVQRTLEGQKAWPLHLVNILLHAAVAFAVAELAWRLGGAGPAWIAGVLFAVHPAHVEAIAGIVGRCELACALATVCGLCLFLGRPMNRWRIALISLCCALALLSKEQGLLFPALLLALLPFRSRHEPERTAPRAMKILAASICYITASYIVLREYTVGFWWDRIFLDWEMNPLVRSHGIDLLLMPIDLVGRYLVLLLAPHHQSLDYGAYAIGSNFHWPDPYFVLGAIAIFTWIVALVWSWRTKRWAVFFCFVAFALTYGMIANAIALIGTIVADRLIYLPSVFFLILIALFISGWPRPITSVLVIVLALAGAWRSFSYASIWNSPRELFTLSVQNQPGSERAYDLLYTELKQAGEWEAAQRIGMAAVNAVPDSDRPYVMCIEADMALGQRADALRMYNRGMGVCRGFDKTFLVLAGGQLLNSPPPTTSPQQ